MELFEKCISFLVVGSGDIWIIEEYNENIGTSEEVCRLLVQCSDPIITPTHSINWSVVCCGCIYSRRGTVHSALLQALPTHRIVFIQLDTGMQHIYIYITCSCDHQANVQISTHSGKGIY